MFNHHIDQSTIPLTPPRTPTHLPKSGQYLVDSGPELETRIHERARDLEQANRELETFTWAVSHDLRSPLCSIKGFAELLQENLAPHLDAASRDLFARLLAEASKMETLITSLLNLSRASRADLHTTSVNLSSQATAILARFAACDPARCVQIRIENNLLAQGDEPLLAILLDNLLSNAWKYTAKRPDASIRLYALPSHCPTHKTFCLEDNGAGFDMALAHRLFLPFHRLHTSADFPGIGLGLATVQRILHRQAGTISVNSAPDTGTRFTFTLPA